MAIEFKFNDEIGMIIMSPKGTISLDEVIEYEAKFLSENCIPPKYVEVIKMDGIEDIVFSYKSFKAMFDAVELWKKHGHKLTLFCAFTEKHKEMADLLLPIFQHIDITIQVCYSQKEYEDMLVALNLNDL